MWQFESGARIVPVNPPIERALDSAEIASEPYRTPNIGEKNDSWRESANLIGEAIGFSGVFKEPVDD